MSGNKIPDTIRIGPFDYEIRKHDSPFIEGELNNGLHNSNHLKIDLNTDVPPIRQFQVMWHEALHGILDCAGMEPQDEERIVETIASGIVQLLRDNPWMGRPNTK